MGKLAEMLRAIRGLLPATDEYVGMELPAAVRKYINDLGCRASDPIAARVGWDKRHGQFAGKDT